MLHKDIWDSSIKRLSRLRCIYSGSLQLLSIMISSSQYLQCKVRISSESSQWHESARWLWEHERHVGIACVRLYTPTYVRQIWAYDQLKARESWIFLHRCSRLTAPTHRLLKPNNTTSNASSPNRSNGTHREHGCNGSHVFMWRRYRTNVLQRHNDQPKPRKVSKKCRILKRTWMWTDEQEPKFFLNTNKHGGLNVCFTPYFPGFKLEEWLILKMILISSDVCHLCFSCSHTWGV